MDIIIFLIHLIISFILVDFKQGLLISIYTALWYSFIDRGIINIILTILIKPLLVFLNVKDRVAVGTFWIEIIKAPLSAYFGVLILMRLLPNSFIILPFVIGIALWSFNFHFIGGVFKNHPLRVIMYICVLIGIILSSSLIK